MLLTYIQHWRGVYTKTAQQCPEPSASQSESVILPLRPHGFRPCIFCRGRDRWVQLSWPELSPPKSPDGFHEVNQKPLSIASPTFSLSLASATAKAAALLASLYVSDDSEDPWANQTEKASIFSLTAVPQWVPGLLPWQALMTLWPQPQAAASTMDALNISDLISITSP